jgi:hypothetical protein
VDQQQASPTRARARAPAPTCQHGHVTRAQQQRQRCHAPGAPAHEEGSVAPEAHCHDRLRAVCRRQAWSEREVRGEREVRQIERETDKDKYL